MSPSQHPEPDPRPEGPRLGDRPFERNPDGHEPPRTAGGATGGLAKPGPVFPEDLVKVTAWPDPVLDKLGHDPRSGYVERYWLPILGPSCLLLLRRLAAELERNPEGFELNTAQWAGEIGLGMKGGRNGPFWRSIERGCRFGAAQRNGPLLAVRRRLPPLTARQLERLPESLRRSHQVWTEARLATPKRATVAKWPQHVEPPEQTDLGERHLDDAA